MPFFVRLADQNRADLTFESGEYSFSDSGVLEVRVSDDEVRYFAPGYWVEVRNADVL